MTPREGEWPRSPSPAGLPFGEKPLTFIRDSLLPEYQKLLILVRLLKSKYSKLQQTCK